MGVLDLCRNTPNRVRIFSAPTPTFTCELEKFTHVCVRQCHGGDARAPFLAGRRSPPVRRSLQRTHVIRGCALSSLKTARVRKRARARTSRRAPLRRGERL